jgi:signal transduction histidine kinase
MRSSRFNFFRPFESLRFVVGLLALLVLAPTIGLAWLLLAAVENERAALQQKMLDACVQDLRGLGESLDAPWREALQFCEAGANLAPAAAFAAFAERSLPAATESAGLVLVIADERGGPLYPPADNEADDLPAAAAVLTTAWQFEFAEGKPREALELYTRLAALDAGAPAGWEAQLGQVRTLLKTGAKESALRICTGLASPKNEAASGSRPTPPVIAARAKVLLAHYQQPASVALPSPALEDLLTTATAYNPVQPEYLAPLPAPTRILLLNEAVAAAEKTAPLSPELQRRKQTAERLLAAERQTAALTGNGARLPAFQEWPADQVHLFGAPGRAFLFLRHAAGARQMILLRPLEAGDEGRGLQHLIQTAAGPGFACRLFDSAGRLVPGSPATERTAVFEMPVSRLYAQWRIALVREQEKLEPAARRRIALYAWVGLLAAAGILIVLVIALGALRRHVRLNRIKSDLLALLAHELKTPLASTRAMLETLREGRYRDAAQVQDYLRLAGVENDKLCRLVENFLTLSRVERDRRPLRLEPVAPKALVEEALRAMQGRIAECGAKVAVEVAPDLPDLAADRAGLLTVLTNLLDNACKYGYDGRIQIRIAVGREGPWICFRIEDNGIGFSRREARKLFRPFYQADRALSRRGGGCGLGLSIVKSIVDAHRGRVEARSRPGQGSVFTVKLRVLWACTKIN